MKLSGAFAFAFSVLFAVSISLTAQAGPFPDTDSDGIPDEWDNCLDDSNTAQGDWDLDGYGDVCDQDINNDGAVGVPDFNAFITGFGKGPGQPGYNACLDFTGDGPVGVPDFNVFIAAFNGTPGASGLPCAGTIPCSGI